LSFLTANIDRAIVMTQYDLRGFSHPLGVRMTEPSPKFLDATTHNFVAFAAHAGESGPTDDSWFQEADRPFEDYLRMCQRLFDDCDASEREAIKLIVEEIVRQYRELVSGALEKGEGLPYLPQQLDQSSHWGRLVLALVETFEVEVGEASVAV